MRYLTAEEVAEINASFPQGCVILDAGLLASAVGRPAQSVFGADAYESLWLKVAAMFESLVRNHCFLHANKRTAVVAAIHMLNWNGYDLVAAQCDIVNLALDCAEGLIDIQKIAEFLQEHADPLTYPDTNEEGL
jgi:death on curing protein